MIGILDDDSKFFDVSKLVSKKLTTTLTLKLTMRKIRMIVRHFKIRHFKDNRLAFFKFLQGARRPQAATRLV